MYQLPDSIAIRLITTTRLLFPEVTDKTNVYEFVKETLPTYLPRVNEVWGTRAQAVIALFRVNTMLNTQIDGNYQLVSPALDLDKEIHTLRLRTASYMAENLILYGSNVVRGIEKYTSTV